MKRAILVLCVVMAVVVGVRLACPPGDVKAGEHKAQATVTITARVDEFAEWADAAPVIIEADWSGPVSKLDQRQTVTRPMVLYTNADTTVTAKAGLNNGVLTKGSQTLETAYKMGGAVTPTDQRFKPAAEFFGAGNSYTVIHTPGTGTYPITLEVQLSSPAKDAPEKGLYVCGLTLTAEW